ncbi:hypothetical protein SMACR_08422 [Sordaria macrospora]|uniref:Uncharacterized protein n=1 Tax=Sordaria macrospora TaxID=5147 RepID=A0A8S8ZKE4_SORMA|nr:hypothetical protein SMACR_08422 [Sordaria macrospora]
MRRRRIRPRAGIRLIRGERESWWVFMRGGSGIRCRFGGRMI